MSIYRVCRFVLLYVVLCALSQTFGQEEHLFCGRRKVKTVYLIQNGIDAKAGHWPWHAAIFHRRDNDSVYACGGSIIDESTILTAAHCVSTASGLVPLRRISVSVGQTDLKQRSELMQTHNVRELIVHPQFSKHSIVHDIALVKLATNITMTKYVQPVCLWTMDESEYQIVGKNGTIVGFGLTEHDVVSEQLKQALVSVVEPLACIASDRGVFGTHLTSDMFCGKGQPGVSACNGDSGGGMFFEVGGRWYVRGLVSFTPVRAQTSYCDGTKSTVFTDVARYLEWITNYIDRRVLPTDSDVIEIDYVEKMRLFDFNVCGDINQSMGVLISSSSFSSRIQNCATTLISKWYTVSPAHCFPKDGSKLEVMLGGLNAYDELQIVQIQRVIIHPKYNSTTLANDIALIELYRPVTHVDPVCLPAPPEVRKHNFENLIITTVQENSHKDGYYASGKSASYVNDTECVKKLAMEGFANSLEPKQFCLQLSSDENGHCVPFKAGKPLLQVDRWGEKEYHFLRGLDLFARPCDAGRPSVYIDTNEYVDWILYHMRYNVLDDDEPEELSAIDYEWITYQSTQDDEKFSSFNTDDCGLIISFDQILTRYPNMPWIGWLHENPNITLDDLKFDAMAILISRRYALATAKIMQNQSLWRYFTVGSLGNFLFCRTVKCKEYIDVMDVKKITIHPDFAKDPRANDIALIEFWQPVILKNPYINPICLPFTQSMRNGEPISLTMSTIDLFYTQSRQLKQLNATNCQQQFLRDGYAINHQDISLCALDSDQEKQPPVPVLPGAPLQALLHFKGAKRYFLRGLYYDISDRFVNQNAYSPYLFTDIERYFDWIFDEIEGNINQDILIRSDGNDRLPVAELENDQKNLLPIDNPAKRRLFDFNACGTGSRTFVSGRSINLTYPWFGIINSPYTNNRCQATLVSARYLVGLASCVKNYTDITLGVERSETTRRIPIQRVIVHPQYTSGDVNNDIALIQLESPVNITIMKPICLPIPDEVRAMGYRRSNLATIGNFTEAIGLLATKVGSRYVHSSYCQKYWRSKSKNLANVNSTICVYSLPLTSDERYTQFEGSPIFNTQNFNEQARQFLHGIALNGVFTLNKARPITFLEIDSYLGWILNNIDEPLSQPVSSYNLQETLVFT
uniref:Peptidase S1 domain-containing protein n=1 Tax=Anopheles dirus TaxID=7168 RepID=A0A182NF46_9DIPT